MFFSKDSKMALNICSDRMGQWYYGVIDCFVQRAFPHIQITHNPDVEPDLVIRSTDESEALEYTCPYICVSGESDRVTPKEEYEPMFEITSIYTDDPKSVYIPYLALEQPVLRRPDVQKDKRYCCAFVYSNRVAIRENFFRSMRSKEATSYAFGRSMYTFDNPFVASNRDGRSANNSQFQEFGFYIAMENTCLPGYITEKIGFAYNSGTVPIYWGDSDTVNRFFHPESFIDVETYRDIDHATDTIVEIWRDKQKYQKYLDAPITRTKELDDYLCFRTEYRPWQAPILDGLRDTFTDYQI